MYHGVVRQPFESKPKPRSVNETSPDADEPPARLAVGPSDAAAVPGGVVPRRHELLQNRSFALLWGGQLVSMIGLQCLIVAGITLIADVSHSPLALLIPALCVTAPQVVLGLMGGVIADRLSRKRVMIISDLARALIVLTLLLVTTPGQIWILYAAAAGLALAGAFFDPARNASLPRLVPDHSLIAANGLIQSSHVIALILGPVIGGFALELWQPSAFLLASGAFVVSAAAVTLMRIPPNGRVAAEAGQTNLFRDVRDGLAFIRRSRVLRRVLAVTAVATLGAGAVLLLAIPHLKTTVGAGGLQYGIAMSALGLGSLLGCGLVTRLGQGVAATTMVGGMLILAGAAIVAFAYAPGYAVVLASVALIGMCLVVARGTLDALTQTVAPDEMRGRVQSAVHILIVSSAAAAAGFAAVLGSLVPPEIVFVAAAATTTAAGLAALLALREAADALRTVVAQPS